MTTFIGFSTIDRAKKFTLTDSELVQRDFLNALNIRQGEVPGRPDYGTRIWDFVFDSQTPDLLDKINNEIQRVAAQDPRIIVSSVNFFPALNGIQIEVAVQIVPSSTVELLSIFFDQDNLSARRV